jgi:hypothetical protein
MTDVKKILIPLRYYEASIEEITTDGQVSVKFLGYGNQGSNL